MPRESDIKWASSLPPELHKPPSLAPLNQLVTYTDHSGELSLALGDAGQPGRTYPGATAIAQLGRGAPCKLIGELEQHDRLDAVERFYQRVLAHSGSKKTSSLSRILKLEGASPSLVFRIYDRYWNTADFPLNLPTQGNIELLIGNDGDALKTNSVLRSAIFFFMRLYTDLSVPTRNWLAGRISSMLAQFKGGGACPRSLQAWVAASSLLFSDNSAHKLAEVFIKNGGSTFGTYASQINLPEHSGLFASTRLEVLCMELRALPHQPNAGEKELINRLNKEKDERIDSNWTVAAKCLEILVNRSIDELGGMPSDTWCDIIVDLGCHPDPTLSGQVHQRYWHWANQKQLDAARMAFVRRDLEIVFEYLKQAANKGQMGGHMVAPRVDFYKKLLRNGLIRDTRLFLGTNVAWNLRTRMKKDQFWDLHEAGDPDLCIIALMLAEGINLTTGTKSFPMRFYRSDSKEFRNLWEDFSPTRTYPIFNRHHFMHDAPDCIRKPHQGDWKKAVIEKILTKPFLGKVDWSHYDL